jgi:hypothetical protein
VIKRREGGDDEHPVQHAGIGLIEGDHREDSPMPARVVDVVWPVDLIEAREVDHLNLGQAATTSFAPERVAGGELERPVRVAATALSVFRPRGKLAPHPQQRLLKLIFGLRARAAQLAAHEVLKREAIVVQEALEIARGISPKNAHDLLPRRHLRD